MPFLSVRILQSTATVPFIQFNAGQDQNVLCAEVVELNAVILQGDINDHLFEWEQIEGTPVTLNDAETLTPWFLNPNTTDLVFRFWIDRGTPFERFSDVNIFRQLASTASSSITVTGGTPVPEVLELGRNSSDARMLQDILVEPTSYTDQDGSFTPSTCKNGPYAIIWQRPIGMSIRTVLLGVEVQKLVNGVWVTDGIQIPERRYWNIENGVTYRLVVIWQDTLRGTVSRETDNVLYRSPINSMYKRNAFTSVTSSVPSISGTYQLTSFSTFIPTLISLDEPEVNATPAPSISGISQLTGFSTFIPGLAALFEPETSATPGPSSSGLFDPDIYVFRVSGISIGSPG